LPLDASKVAPALHAPASSLQSDSHAAPSTVTGALVERGTELVEATARMVKEEESERAGQVKDRPITTSNIVANKLRRSKENEAVPEPGIGDEALPKVPKALPPPIAHLPDVMIDMAGYHSKDASDQTVMGSESRFHFDDYISASAATRAQEALM
jgi:hypothetical protein